MHLSAWPNPPPPTLPTILARIHALLHPTPPSELQTHLLHLASLGEILPHVDNLEASGNVILGVSLGGERVLRMSGVGAEGKKKDRAFDVLLRSGDVYIQR